MLRTNCTGLAGWLAGWGRPLKHVKHYTELQDQLRVKFRSQTKLGVCAFATSQGSAAELFDYMHRMMKAHAAVTVRQGQSNIVDGEGPFTDHYIF